MYKHNGDGPSKDYKTLLAYPISYTYVFRIFSCIRDASTLMKRVALSKYVVLGLLN